jgi:hypothetical protein
MVQCCSKGTPRFLFVRLLSVGRIKDFRSGTCERRGDRALGLPLRTQLPCPRRRSCCGCGNGKPSDPRVARAWTLVRHVRCGLREGQSQGARVRVESYITNRGGLWRFTFILRRCFFSRLSRYLLRPYLRPCRRRAASKHRPQIRSQCQSNRLQRSFRLMKVIAGCY